MGIKAVADAAIREIWNGNNLTRPSVIELEAAETICKLIPGLKWSSLQKTEVP